MNTGTPAILLWIWAVLVIGAYLYQFVPALPSVLHALGVG